ncbi:hypothetical protein IGI37_000320 [Enterococcus sp. AZ194]|uniref:hypothetical protein n=1 Tax=Enterococcus sp. AZ194 TaxID=2774629 RepID=UPI003F1E8A8F
MKKVLYSSILLPALFVSAYANAEENNQLSQSSDALVQQASSETQETSEVAFADKHINTKTQIELLVKNGI